MRILIPLLLIASMATAAWGANSNHAFGGVGIDGLPRADGEIEIRQVVQGGPADKAGIVKGDVITHIDGKATRGSDFSQMVQYRLRGESGTPVTLKIHRPGESKQRVFTLTRRQLIIGNGKQGAEQ